VKKLIWSKLIADWMIRSWKGCIKNIYIMHELMCMNIKSIFMYYLFLVCKEYTSSPEFAGGISGYEKTP